MTTPDSTQELRVGSLRPNQLLHTYGVGAMADLPNLSVVMLGLEHWALEHARTVHEERLLGAIRARLGRQVNALRLPPHLPETSNPFDEWARVGAPVGLFPTWLRCSNCGRLGEADSGLFNLQKSVQRPEFTKYTHSCYLPGRNTKKSGTAVPARFVIACPNGHLDDFPWQYFVHRGNVPTAQHPLKMTESGTTGEAANVFVSCDDCSNASPMSDAFGDAALENLPACRGRHPHLGTFEKCGQQVKTLVLGATNGWFPMRLNAITIPRDLNPVDHLVTEFFDQLSLLLQIDEDKAKGLLPSFTCWPQLEPYGSEEVLESLRRHAAKANGPAEKRDDTDLHRPEWDALSAPKPVEQPDFTTLHEGVPRSARSWLHNVVLVSRLREVGALYGFTRIDAPEWDPGTPSDRRRAPLASSDPTWVPCAELRGEGIFLQFNEERVAQWEQSAEVNLRERASLLPAYHRWCDQRHLPRANWPGLRYLLLHTFSHALIREFALESGYSAAGIGERIYARSSNPAMAGILIYTAAPDSEGTLGGLVSLGRQDRLRQLIERALDSARLCGSDPLCAEHDPTVHGRLHGAACHACLFSSETSCEAGNHFLDRALLVETLSGARSAFFAE